MYAFDVYYMSYVVLTITVVTTLDYYYSVFVFNLPFLVVLKQIVWALRPGLAPTLVLWQLDDSGLFNGIFSPLPYI